MLAGMLSFFFPSFLHAIPDNVRKCRISIRLKYLCIMRTLSLLSLSLPLSSCLWCALFLSWNEQCIRNNACTYTVSDETEKRVTCAAFVILVDCRCTMVSNTRHTLLPIILLHRYFDHFNDYIKYEICSHTDFFLPKMNGKRFLKWGMRTF